jgi:hypothetical protein
LLHALPPKRWSIAVRRAAVALGCLGLLAAATVALQSVGGTRREARANASDLVGAAVAAPTTTQPAAANAANARPASPPTTGPAYRLVAADGGVFTRGWYAHRGSGVGLTPSPITGLAQTADGEGYWLASRDGGVFAFGSAGFFGSGVGDSTSPIVDISSAPGDAGYLLVSRAGGVFTFGSATFHGSLVDQHLNSPIVAVVSTPSGEGYWLAASDGGVFAFGDAPYAGGAAEKSLHAPIISIVSTISGNGYWLVGSDGGVFAFGDAPYFGSLAGQRLNKPIVDMAAESSGRGYWLVSADGGVFAFGDAPFLGSVATGRLNAPVVGIAGGVGTKEPAAAPVEPLPAPTPVPAPVHRATGAALDGAHGWDVSFPQCGGALPQDDLGFGIVGVTSGMTFTHNPCLGEQWRWALSTRAAGIYVNVNFPSNASELALGATSSRQRDCNGAISCIAYNFGFNGAADAVQYAREQGVVGVPLVWIDVEQLNYWTADTALNSVVLRGAVDAIREAGMDVGVYSTPYQYGRIAGGEVLGVPVWSAGAPGFEAAASYCVERSFGGGPVALVQLLPGQFDANLACSGAGATGRYFKLG